MDVAFSMLADGANVSREGKLNILGAFDRIQGSKFPMTWPRMILVTRFLASAAEFGTEKTIEFVTLDADGKQLGRATGKMKISKGHPGRQLKVNHIFPMTMTFPAPGQYSIEILVNGEPKATVPIEIVQRPDKQNGQAESGDPPTGGGPPPDSGPQANV